MNYLYKVFRSTSLVLLSVVLTGALAAVAQNFNLTSVKFTVENTSVISILGSSTVGPFRCESNAISGGGQAGLEHEVSGDPFVEARLESDVAAFDCKNDKITSDLSKALKRDEYPQLALLIDAGFARPPAEDEAGDYVVRVAGLLTIAGVEKRFDVTLTAVRESFLTFRLTGSHDVIMTDFGIDPPSALLGLIKTRDQITIDFNLMLSPTF